MQEKINQAIHTTGQVAGISKIVKQQADASRKQEAGFNTISAHQAEANELQKTINDQNAAYANVYSKYLTARAQADDSKRARLDQLMNDYTTQTIEERLSKIKNPALKDIADELGYEMSVEVSRDGENIDIDDTLTKVSSQMYEAEEWEIDGYNSKEEWEQAMKDKQGGDNNGKK